jgi:MFS family permease/N-acetylglutamate synthase-like GNAT family acetyltransferase
VLLSRRRQARPAGAGRSLVPPLLRDLQFRRYWSAQSISVLGDQVSSIALPLVGVLALHAGPAAMGYLTALVWLPFLLFALHAGAWMDRLGRRRVAMMTADLGQAAALTSVPVCYALGVLTLGQLYVVAFVTGSLNVLNAVSESTMLVSLVPADRYVEANSLTYGSRALSFVTGPSLGGLLVQLLTAPVAVLADALSFLGSAFFLSKVRSAEPPAAGQQKGWLTAGVRYITGSRIVRASLGSAMIINFFNFMFFALFILYATRYLHVRPGLLGLVLGAGAVGGVIGAMLARRAAARFGVGMVYTVGCVLFTAPMVLVPLAGGPLPVILAMLFASEFAAGFGVMMLDIAIGSIFASVIPDRLRSRVVGAFQAANYGTRPLGAVAGGTLGALIGVRPTLWIAVLGGITGFLWLLPSPVPRFRMPAAATDAAPGDPGPGPAADSSGPAEPGTQSAAGPYPEPVLTVRRAAEADVPELQAIAVAAYRDYAPRIGRNPAPMSADYAAAVRDGQAWVAEADGRIVGLLVLAARPGHLLLENVAVLPVARRAGIGARLLAVAEDEARRLGLGEIRLYTKRGHDREPCLLPAAWLRGDAPGRAGRVPPRVLQQAPGHALSTSHPEPFVNRCRVIVDGHVSSHAARAEGRCCFAMSAAYAQGAS